ncbi:MAG: 2,3-bisphosphoglycerate-dependent phosphoglycerate mutase [Patescibacteria group bacterium]|nr:2,3-bisphosphoglycerate-dependent phosphoglycerate mutase [Patescibacteria group bacterium]
MIKIVLLRHGESVWNKKNLFTGWTDVDLTKRGVLEAQDAGRKLSQAGFIFDIAFASYLKRAKRTMRLVLQEMGQKNLHQVFDWRLNERHYGDLQGFNKKEMAEKFGEKQVLLWRRSYGVRPPEISKKNKYNQANDKMYAQIQVPDSESLKDVVVRVKKFWQEEIVPLLKENKKILIVASGNSLRALVKYLDGVSAKEITKLNIPTGVPLVYELGNDLKPRRHYYLADKKELKARTEKVINQGKK